MHICFITNEYPKDGYPHGGIGTFVKTLGEALVLAGLDVSVVGIGYQDFNEHENDHGVEIYRIASKKVKGVTWYLNSQKINEQIDYINSVRPINIIESSESGMAFIKKRDNIKYIIRLHGGHHFFAEAENRGINWWKGLQEKWSFSKADYVIGVSNYVLTHTADYLNFKKKQGPSIYNPIDLEKFYEADPQKVVKGRIFLAGTVCEKKGVRQLIQAFPLIKEAVPEASLFIAGRDWKFPDGSSYTAWVKQFIAEDVRKSITFLGSLKNVEIPSLIEMAEVCIYPSHMEAMPLAWLEVLAMGKAFVGSSIGPGPEVIKDRVTGLLCNPLDPYDIAEKAVEILKNQKLALALGRAARQDVVKRFSLEKILGQNIDFYNGIIKSYL